MFPFAALITVGWVTGLLAPAGILRGSSLGDLWFIDVKNVPEK